MGLVSYDSSDEDEEVQPQVDAQPPKPAVIPPTSDIQTAPKPKPTTTTNSSTPTPPQPPAPGPALGPVLGPTFGPSRPPPPTTNTNDQDPSEEIDLAFLSQDPTPQNQDQNTEPPRSPHTRTRTLLHNLTLPAVPNMDIPPSPPGSPPPGLDALTAKFDTFLRLKRTRGVHFNERLARSAGMANPAVADRLLGFVGVGTEFGGGADAEGGGDGGGDGVEGGVGAGSGGRGVEQYATVLSAEVWDPACFPAWAYRGPLRKAQERGTKERERGRGEAVEFVAASAGGAIATAAVGGGGTGSAGGSRSGTPGVGGASGRKKGRWDM
ncbi:uncharacterized protein B0H64DRAFT_83070 [Chaetomium fimeti]|uniref:HCNGP-like protein n=1 Tax=Chaetomium fimeti TaxID=1854472 RepID=A0AAE0LVG6_9PEZI|nr:hypothetical protein B0H64DRAFT_83070 [Chaetomium fimeti]